MRTLVLCFSLLLSLAACAQESAGSKTYREGVHYTELPQPVAVVEPEKIEVTEVFWYGCSHCFHFEPEVVRWEKTLADDVNFVRMPAMWNRAMEMHARIYYTAESLGVLEDAHQAVFNALNIDRKRLVDPEEIADLLAKYGAEREAVLKTLNSFGTTSKLKQADAKARGYQISGTPQVIVHGRYRIEANTEVSQGEMLNVADYLVDQIRRERSE